MNAVPLPRSVKPSPGGRFPALLREAPGKPDVVIKNVENVPSWKVAVGGLTNTGVCSTLRFKVSVLVAPLLAWIKIWKMPPLPITGVPLMVAVPLPLSVNVSPAGRVAPPP